MGVAKRLGWVSLIVAALLLMLVVSLVVGSNALRLDEVFAVTTGSGSTEATRVVLQQRVPRMLLVLLVGAALAVAGALMQSLTRNPLADPGILGINAGASLAVVGAVALFGVTSIWFYLWFSLVGAAVASVVVYILGGGWSAGATPARLVLAGVAVSMAVSSFVQLVILTDQHVFNEFRFWSAGSLESRGYDIVTAVAPFIALGLVLAFIAAPGLNVLALGDAAGQALGVNVAVLRVIVLVAIALLAGAGTAAVGPIMFVGLGVPYLARALCGPDLRWVVPVSALSGPLVLIVADLFARTVVAPQEVQTGIVTALLGGPLFVAIVRRGTRKGR